MFCYQCEQTAKGEACTVMGVCGKQPEIAALQDLLVHVVEGISLFAAEGERGASSTRTSTSLPFTPSSPRSRM